MKIKITEIFFSIDGEINRWGIGGWSTFIRFQGCTAGCLYCDVKESMNSQHGMLMSIREIMKEVKKNDCQKITITGGEPFEQEPGLLKLVQELHKEFYDISIETNGLHKIKSFKQIVPYVNLVMDFKYTTFRTSFKNYVGTTSKDNIKILVRKEEDFQHLFYKIRHLKSITDAQISVGAVAETLSERDLITLLRQYKLTRLVKLNVQLHKLIGVE